MLIRPETFDAIKAGTIDRQFRRWTKPTVKTGGSLTTAWGVLAIDAVEPIALADITADELPSAGLASVAELESYLAPEGQLYRVQLRYAGEDPRIALRDALPDEGELAVLAKKLIKLDGSVP